MEKCSKVVAIRDLLDLMEKISLQKCPVKGGNTSYELCPIKNGGKNER
jgi:hypothetical protein